MKRAELSDADNSRLTAQFEAAGELYAAGKSADAASLYREILRRDEQNLEARFNLGSCLSCLGQFEQAIDASSNRSTSISSII